MSTQPNLLYNKWIWKWKNICRWGERVWSLYLHFLECICLLCYDLNIKRIDQMVWSQHFSGTIHPSLTPTLDLSGFLLTVQTLLRLWICWYLSSKLFSCVNELQVGILQINCFLAQAVYMCKGRIWGDIFMKIKAINKKFDGKNNPGR